MIIQSPRQPSILSQRVWSALPLKGEMGKFYRVDDEIYAWSNITQSYFLVNGGGGGGGITSVNGYTGPVVVLGASDVGADPAGSATSAYNSSVAVTQSGSAIYATTSGVNTYTASLTPTLTAYTAGLTVHVLFGTGNTGAATLNLNSLGAKNIVKNGGQSLSAFDIVDGQVYTLVYDGTHFHISGIIGLPASAAPSIFSNNSTITNIGSITENLMWSTPISGNTLVAGDRLEMSFHISTTVNLNNKTFRLYFNTANNLVGATQIAFLQITNTGGFGMFQRFISVASSTSSRILLFSANAFTGLGNNASGYTTLTTNYAVTQYLILTMQCANAADSMICYQIKGFVLR